MVFFLFSETHLNEAASVLLKKHLSKNASSSQVTGKGNTTVEDADWDGNFCRKKYFHG